MSGASAVQTAVDIHPGLGFAGQEYDNGPKNVITRIAGETITFGQYIIESGESCELPDSAAEVTARRGGVALRDPTLPNGYYVAGDPVAMMIGGRVWVPTEEAVGVTDTVFVRFAGASGASEAQGYFRNDADGVTGAANAANPQGVIWHKAGSALAVLELGVPGAAGGATTPTG